MVVSYLQNVVQSVSLLKVFNESTSHREDKPGEFSKKGVNVEKITTGESAEELTDKIVLV